MPFGFRRRKVEEEDGAAVANYDIPLATARPRPASLSQLDSAVPAQAEAAPETPSTPTPITLLTPPPAAATTPVMPPNGIPQRPMKTQATATDARAERFFRQVRAEVDELRRSMGERREVDDQFAELDIEAVVADPEAAAQVPPEVLVKALIETHRANGRTRRKLARSRARTAKLEGRIHDLKEEWSFERGRLETLDRVIEALHANLEDLRLARDSELPRVEGRPEPRVLRAGGLGQDALPPAENG